FEGSRCDTSPIRATVPLRFGSEPCHVALWWNAPPPAFTTTGTTSSSDTSDGCASRTPASQSSGAGNCALEGGETPQWFEPRTYAIGPASAAVSCSDIQHVTISGGTRKSGDEPPGGNPHP